MIEVLTPQSRDEWLNLRKPNIGASVVGALLGAHEYTTAYGLWALATGAIAEDPEETAPMRRGRLLEPVAVEMLREERPHWNIDHNPMPGGKYFVDRSIRLSSTPDAFAVDPERKGFGVIQIKNVEAGVFARKWKDPETGEIQPPLWIAVQAIIDAHMSGASWAAVAPLVVSYGIDLQVIDVPLHDGIVKRARAEVESFWRMVEGGHRPDPDYGRDGALIEQLYNPTREIISLEADNALPALADEREALSAAKSSADKRLKAIKAEMLAKLGDAEAGRISDGRLITAKRIERAGYEVKPSSYVKVDVKKAAREAA